MQERVAKIISVIFHPLLIPTFGLIILFNTGTYLSYTPFSVQLILYLRIFFATYLLPISLIILLYKIGVIENILLNTKQDRTFPLLVSGVSFLLAYYLLLQFQIGLPAILVNLLLVSCVSVFANFGINFFWKISSHTIGIGGLTALALSMFFQLNINTLALFSSLIFLSGLLATARLFLQEHTPAQVYVGFLLGFFIAFSIL